MDSDKSARLLFQIKIDDIRYSKKQQWNVIYLTLIALAGIISLALSKPCNYSVSDLYLSLKGILTVAVYGISIAGCVLLLFYQCDICRYRKDKVYFAKQLGLDKHINKKRFTPFDFLFLFIFIGTIVIGFLITRKIIENL